MTVTYRVGSGTFTVSIQLVSPASGELSPSSAIPGRTITRWCFHSISFPSEWGEDENHKDCSREGRQSVSIQLVSPASGEWGVRSINLQESLRLGIKFPFN